MLRPGNLALRQIGAPIEPHLQLFAQGPHRHLDDVSLATIDA
jgi:hypothetical protein